ncbi:MAG: Ig-like domain-containing protein [Longimicrobiaceae bacterium]
MRWIHLSLTLAAIAAAACADSAGPELRQPAKLEIVYGQGQTGTVGSRLETLVSVRVVDARGWPVAGQPVSFAVTAGGGSVSPATDLTNRHGVAQSWWTMGPTAGAQTVEARVAAGATMLSTTFTARGTPGAAVRLARYPVPDDSGFVSGIGGVLEGSPAVQVLDAFGNPVPGVEVAWRAPDGSGTVASPTTTDSLGVARTTWRLGSETDQLAYASVEGLGELRFVAQAATSLANWKCKDDCWWPEAGSRVRIGIVVVFASSPGPAAGVTFDVAPGGGSVTPAVATSEKDSSGANIAWVEWTLGDAPGPQKLTARLGGLQMEFVVNALPRLVPVAEVPGTVLDATSDRVLWVDTASGGRVVKVRTIATGADVTVLSGSSLVGALFDGGALVWDPAVRLIYEYRNGAAASLGSYTAASPLSVEGNWAAWGVEAPPRSPDDFIIRRDLAGGTTLVLPDPNAPQGVDAHVMGHRPDVGPHGEVVFIQGSQARLYRNGSFGGLISTYVRDAQTDGVNVAYTRIVPSVSPLHQVPPTAWLCLSSALGVTCPLNGMPITGDFSAFHYELAGGWFVYDGLGRTFRRSPAGVQDYPDFCGIDALAPDGTLVCSDDSYRLVRPDGTAYGAGRRNGGRVVWRGDRFLVIRGGSVYTFGPPPAAQLR